MKRAICSSCGAERPVSETLILEEKPLCRSCAEKCAQEAEAAGRSIRFIRLLDPTICSKCNTDYGSTQLPLIGGAPFCANCSQGLYSRPFPTWLKFSLTGLLIVLAVALWRGAPYFRAGRHLVLGQRAMDRHDYRTAAAHFAEVRKVKPTKQKVVLSGAKADLLTGDLEGAQQFLNQRQTYDADNLFEEVNGMWKRATDAYDKEVQAGKLVESHQDEEAARLMHEASVEYPESPEMAEAALRLDAGVAFDRKDYDTFLRLSQDTLKSAPDDPSAMGAVASALACKYVVTGDAAFRSQAEEMLARAQTRADRNPESKANFAEYAERIRYRIDKRDIIDRDEYNRRFRQKGAQH